jgi:hypothetical protein
MKKVVLLFSAVILFAGLTFGQTPQTKDKSAPAPSKTEAPAAKKDAAGCEKTCTHKAKSCGHEQKSGCCAKKATDSKQETKTATPEKK